MDPAIEIDRTAQAKATPTWLVVVGASGAAGLQQISALISALPRKLPAAVLVVLQRPPNLPSHLPEILARAGRIPVVVPSPGEALKPGVCYLGRPDSHLLVAPGPTAAFAEDHVYRGTNVDLLFESAARTSGRRVMGVLLAGALGDGAAGLAAIKQAGGVAMTIDSIRATGDVMPRAALQQLANAVVKRAATPAPVEGAENA